MNEQTESQAAFARRMGVARSTVHKGVASGKVLLDQHGKVRISASLEAWKNATAARPDMSERHAAKRAAKTPAIAALPDTAPSDNAPGMGRASYKAQSLHYENELIRLEMQLRRHQRYPLADIRHEASGLGAMLRAAVERLIDQTAPRLAALPSQPQRAALLREECKRLTSIVKAEFPRALRRIRKAGTK